MSRGCSARTGVPRTTNNHENRAPGLSPEKYLQGFIPTGRFIAHRDGPVYHAGPCGVARRHHSVSFGISKSERPADRRKPGDADGALPPLRPVRCRCAHGPVLDSIFIRLGSEQGHCLERRWPGANQFVSPANPPFDQASSILKQGHSPSLGLARAATVTVPTRECRPCAISLLLQMAAQSQPPALAEHGPEILVCCRAICECHARAVPLEFLALEAHRDHAQQSHFS